MALLSRSSGSRRAVVFPRTHRLAVLAVLAPAASLAAQAGAPPPQEPGAPPVRRSEEEPPESPGGQERVVVTATRRSEPTFETPFAASVVDSQDILRRAYRTTPQALREVPGVMVQETAVGQGSPYIRGFTGYQNLFLIDGIRLNNSVFRSGPNQYWATVNPLSLDRLEIVKGPSSVLYGSDAIGGTVQAFTKDPWTTGEGLTYGGSVYVRYGTANDSLWGRGELSFGVGHEDGSHTGFLIGGDRKTFHDLEGGEGTGDLPYTAYDEWNLDLKVVHRFDTHTRAVFAHQAIRQNDAPRTHRTVFAKPWRGTTVGSDLLHEFDQERFLTYGQVHSEDLGGAIDAIRASVSLHTQKEKRERLRTSGPDEQGFDVDTYGAWVQLESETEIGRLIYGAEWYHDEVDSFSSRNPIQGPVGDDATYDLAAVYVQDRVDLGERTELILGGRFNYAAADADSVQDPSGSGTIQVDDDWDDFVFSARVRHELVEDAVAAYGGISQGFRAPNLSDLTSFNSARSNEFEIPNPTLDSENYLTYEVGLKTRSEHHSFDAAWFWTDIEDQIVRFPTGNTNTAGENEVTKDNVGDGRVWGIELAGSYRVVDSTTLFGSATYMEGRIENFESLGGQRSTEYLTRLMPLTVILGVRWEEIEQGRFWAETMLRYADDADKLSSSDTRDTQRIPPGGTPGYAVWDLGAGWRVADDTTLNARLENVTDVDYRIHGSGTNMPGRHFVIALESRF